MKGKFVVAGLLAALSFGQHADAKSLEDILKEKGVITEEDYKDVTKVKPIDYKIGKGFTFTSADEKFQLSLGGRLMTRYAFTDKEDNSTKSDISTFDVEKAQLWLQGYAYDKNLTYRLQLALEKSGSNKLLEYAYLKYRVFDELQVLGGQTKVPFSRQYLTSIGQQEFVDRSPVTNAFRPGYDTGAYVSGKVLGGILNYDIGWIGGLGQTTFRADNDNAVVARIVTNPLGDFAYSEGDLDNSKKPLFTLGADFYYNTLQKTGASTFQANNNYAGSSGWLGKNAAAFSASEKVRITTVSADAAFKWKGAFVEGEYYLGQGDGTQTKTTVISQGGYGQIGYFILPKKLEAAFRYSNFDPNRGKSNDLQTEVIGAVSYYFNKHNLKVQADVGSIHTQGAQTDPLTQLKVPTDDMQYRLNATIVF
jgi:hypothetical protein